MTIAGNQGQNVYPNPDNYPASSFPQPVPAPTVDPDDAGTLIQVQYSWAWQQVLMAALTQLKNPATWQGSHDEIITAINRATDLQFLLQSQVALSDVQTPFWDDEDDVDDTAPPDSQIWYGEMTDPDAPAGELDFVENAAIWAVSGMIAYATGSIGVALAFRTFVSKFVLIQRSGDVVETIRYVIDGQDAVTINTSGIDNQLQEVSIVGDDSLSEHQLYIIKTG